MCAYGQISNAYLIKKLKIKKEVLKFLRHTWIPLVISLNRCYPYYFRLRICHPIPQQVLLHYISSRSLLVCDISFRFHVSITSEQRLSDIKP